MHDDFHTLTRYQAWGREALHFAEQRKDFTGELTITFAFRGGELMNTTRVEGAKYSISPARMSGTNGRAKNFP